jgi:membrane protein DedA with SNARE-associated domain
VKLGPLLLAAALVVAVVIRRRHVTARMQALAAVATLGLIVWGSGLVHPPSVESIARDVGATLGSYTYAVVGLLALLETGAGVGLIAPGELAVVIGGVTAGQGHTDLPLLIAIVWTCAFAGDLVSYALGRRLGRGFLLAHGSAFMLTPARIRQVESFLGRHGGKTIVIGRFIGLVRALAPFIAGSSRMPARRFIPATCVASGIWSAAFSVLGYVFWHSFDDAAAIAQRGTFALVTVVAAVVVLVIVHRALRTREGRQRLRARLRGSLPRRTAEAQDTPPR